MLSKKILFFIYLSAISTQSNSVSLNKKAPTINSIMRILVTPETAGRRPGTTDHDRVRDYLKTQLKDLAFTPAGTDGFEQKFPTFETRIVNRKIGFTKGEFAKEGTNIIGVFYPKGTQKKSPLVLLTAHYDHLGIDCEYPLQLGGTHNSFGAPICPGAADNAGGVAAVLAALPHLVATAKQPFAVAFWDLEEYEFQGSQHFVDIPTFPLDEIRLILNLDIIGLNLFPGKESWSFVLGAETGGSALNSLIHKSAIRTVYGKVMQEKKALPYKNL